MQVETYETTELIDKPCEQIEAETLQLIDKLGLEGQKTLITKDESGEDNLNPYRVMSEEERVVYKTLFPSRHLIKDYKHSIIPLRVLQVAAHAVSLFGKVEVWTTKHYDTDPILVGVNGDSYSGICFLLARWGEALEPYQVLFEKARKILIDKGISKCKDTISEYQGYLTQIEAVVNKQLRGEYTALS